jgi:hypothetical protein
MGTHMKTTVEISDELFVRARKAAEQQGTTLRNLIEEGLQLALNQRREPNQSFHLPTVRGEAVPDDLLERGLHALIIDSYALREDRAVSLGEPVNDSAHDRR